MFGIGRKESKKLKKPLEYKLSGSMNRDIEFFREVFGEDETILFRCFESQGEESIKCCAIFIVGMVDQDIINKNIISPIVFSQSVPDNKQLLEYIKSSAIVSNDVAVSKDIYYMIESIIGGDTLLLVEGCKAALIVGSKGWEKRSIEEPESEKVLRGPREGFTESLVTNLSMIRRKLKTPDLKFRFRTFGKQTNTKACVCYIEGIVNEKILEEVYKRLDDIDIDGVLDTGYIQELISDSSYSPFRTISTTEKPDVVAGKLLEGRIALVLDGTPMVLTMPFIFIEYFHSPDDYYNNFYFASIGRLIRIVAFVITLTVPATYLALITFHQEMIPTDLLLSISAARQGIPFPSVFEALGLMTVFEILRETGTRMPNYIGQALSIVGALVLGQAAVEARFVSAPMVIIIALTGITGLMTPKVKGPVILIRLGLLLLAAFIGVYGIVYGISVITIHLLTLRSFGVMYMSGIGEANFQDIKDTAIRVPWWHMNYRPWFASRKNRKRQSGGVNKS
jgi:spore germination protein KA